jgi:hypothetical protein
MAPSRKGIKQYYIDMIKPGYKGVVTDVYFKKVPHVAIVTKYHFLDCADLSKDMLDSAAVGDSIIKIPDSNYCYLIKHKRRLRLKYLYIPEEVEGMDSLS